MVSSTKITRAEFDEALSRYPDLVKAISAEKATKLGRGEISSTLLQLDEVRFNKLPEAYSRDIALTAKEFLSKEDLVELVTWKLKHGTFRPNLLSLAESNSEDEIKNVTKDAFASYDKDGQVEVAVNMISKLKGVGPATASLILSVHDATKVVFFADEVYVWLCGGTKKDIKYTTKELKDLTTKSEALINKLDVDARDVEKVGFVIIKESEAGAPKNKKTVKEPAPKLQRSEVEIAARKAQLQKTAAKGRAERDAKRAAKEAKGAAFRARIDAAREQAKKDGTYVVRPKPTSSGKPKGRPPGSVKRSANEVEAPDTAASKRSKRA